MANFSLIKSETLPLTKELALEFNQMPAAPVERDLDPRRVKHLREKFEQGLLIPFNWSKVEIDGKFVRMNGQHSSTMLSQLNGDFPNNLMVHLDTYKVDSTKDQALLFRQFDDRKSGRTPADVAGAYQNLYPELADLPKDYAKLGLEGYVWWRHTIEGIPTVKGDDIYEYFNLPNLYPYLHLVGTILSMKTPELKRIQIISAVYETHEINPVKAQEFWHQVARGGVDYEDNHPASILSAWLQEAKDPTNKVKLKPAEYYNGCVFAWNAAQSEKEVKNINIAKLKDNLRAV